ncbi:hypothetical protein [Sagittula sp.]|uniref:hypothetical protein n=1 Tax=Sagittula sp. TaxID=2038081 RepID=UPI00351549F1
MTDLTSRLADRRCPDCNTLQPLFVSQPGSRRVWQRDGAEVIPCPGCAVPLRLEANTRDAKGIVASVLLVAILGGGLLAALRAATVWGLGAWQLGGLLLAIVALGIGVSTVWNGFEARRRPVVVAGRVSGEEDAS